MVGKAVDTVPVSIGDVSEGAVTVKGQCSIGGVGI
ncbi:hypothetical protein ES703_53454 [subsurface metagenome]